MERETHALTGGNGGPIVPATYENSRELQIIVPSSLTIYNYIRIGLQGISGNGAVLYIHEIGFSSGIVAPPAIPENLRLTYSEGAVHLSWNAVAPPITGYYVYRTSSPYVIPVETNRIATIPASTTSFSEPLTGAAYYRVAAYNGSGATISNTSERILRTDRK